MRNDTGAYEGGEISIYYDPMIAKLITHAPSRAAAINHMARALDAFYIDGIQHNIPFLTAIMQHPRWKAGKLSTGFIAEEYPDGFKPQEPQGEVFDVMVAVAAAIDHLGNQRRRQITQQMSGQPVFFLPDRVVDLGGVRQALRVSGNLGEATVIELLNEAGQARRRLTVASDWWPGQPVWFGTLDSTPVAVQVRPVLNGYDLAYGGCRAKAYVYTKREAELAALMPVKATADTSKKLLCPMPGLVVSIAVADGQEVKAGETLAIVEAMKMQNVLKAERDVTVKAVKAKPGDSLAVDAIIMEFV